MTLLASILRLILLVAITSFISCSRPIVEEDSLSNQGAVASSLLELGDGNGELVFSETTVDESEEEIVTIFNKSSQTVSDIVVSGLGREFSFAGGSYPGTGGDCSDTLLSNATCSLVLSYSPEDSGSHSTEMQVSYTVDALSEVAAMTVRGTASEPVNSFLDSTFANNGIFVLDEGTNDQVNDLLINDDDELYLIGNSDVGAVGDDELVVTRLLPDGSLDNLFDSDGRRVIDLATNSEDQATSGVLDAVGDLVVAGKSGTKGAMAKVRDDGLLDTTFGILGSGIDLLSSLLSLSTDVVKRSVMLANGKILSIGESTPLLGGKNFFIVRHTTGGVLDTGLPILGSVLNPGKKLIDVVAGDDEFLNDSVLDNSNRLILAGHQLIGAQNDSLILRVDADSGDLDVAFGAGSGIVRLDICGEGLSDQINSLKVLADNKIIAVGVCISVAGHRDGFIAKFNVDGTLDAGFANSGVLRVDVNSDEDSLSNVVIDGVGNILSCGFSEVSGIERLLFVRVSALGILDTTIGDNGFFTLDLGTANARGKSLKLQADGKVVVAGSVRNLDDDFLAIRIEL